MRILILVLSAMALFSVPSYAQAGTSQEPVRVVRKIPPTPWHLTDGKHDCVAMRRYVEATIIYEMEYARLVPPGSKFRKLPKPIRKALKRLEKRASQEEKSLRKIQKTYRQNYEVKGRGRARGRGIGMLAHSEANLTSPSAEFEIMRCERMRVGLQ